MNLWMSFLQRRGVAAYLRSLRAIAAGKKRTSRNVKRLIETESNTGPFNVCPNTYVLVI